MAQPTPSIPEPPEIVAHNHVSDDAAAPSTVRALIRTARPKQWAKNVLVFAAAGAAGVLDERDVLLPTLVAFVAFCLAASGTYFVNDSVDAEADRSHPTKRNRPIAAGHLSVGSAKVIGVILMITALAVAAPVNGGRLALVVAIYLALTIAYSNWLKREPVLDIAAVAAGFVLRAIAGGVAADVPLSNWFLIVAGAGSLFIVAGKRHAEVHDLGDDSSAHRAVLDEYSTAYLTFVGAIAAGVAITAYCLWAFEKAAESNYDLWYELSIVPFVLGILRYGLLVDRGRGGAPEDVLLSDRMLLGIGVCWVVIFALGVHGA